MEFTILPLFFDTDEVLKALGILIDPGQAFEIRILGPYKDSPGYIPNTLVGYFDDIQKVPEAVSNWDLAGAKGVYVTLNPVQSALLARSYNNITAAKSGETTADKDIVCRRWLLVDIDPERASGISATDEEKAHAWEVLVAVRAFLKERGWPEPIVCDSGNGYHLLFRIDLPANSDLVDRLLKALDKRFSNVQASIDTRVGNPSRIVKLYGTRAEKGDHCPELGRPYRLSKMLSVPNV